jgi:transcriptional regulator with XRE-family HTH domain
VSPDSLAVKLRNARGALDVSEAALRSGILPDRIKEYEAGERRPYTKTLKRLAQVYGVPLGEFMNAEDSRTPRVVSRRGPRRRARLYADAAISPTTVRLPLEVGGEPTVRIVIELLVQAPAQPATAPVEKAEPAPASTVAPVPAAALVHSVSRRPRSWPRERPRETTAPTADSAPLAREATGVARPTPLPRAVDGASGTDPLAAVRRAYSEFRQKK